jgi:hypothetical protein
MEEYFKFKTKYDSLNIYTAQKTEFDGEEIYVVMWKDEESFDIGIGTTTFSTKDAKECLEDKLWMKL